MQGKKGLFLQVTEEPLELTPEIRLQLKQALLPVIYKERPYDIGLMKEYESSGIALDEEDRAVWQACRDRVKEVGLGALDGESGKFKFPGKSERVLAIEALKEKEKAEKKRQRKKEREEKKRQKEKEEKKTIQ